MSFKVQITVRCDHRDSAEDPRTQCRQTISYTRENKGGLSATWVADMTRDNGWWVAGQTNTSTPIKALCPKHIKAEVGSELVAKAQAIIRANKEAQ